MRSCSGHLRRPTALAHHVVGPALAAAGEVLAVGDQALVQLQVSTRMQFTPAWCLNQ